MKRLFAVLIVVVLLSAVVVPLAALPNSPRASELDLLQPQVDMPAAAAELAAAPLAVTSPLSDTTPFFIPLIVRSYEDSPACSPDSPFSLQVAALHEVDPALSGDLAGAQADWLAWYDQAFPDLVTALEESGACWTRVRIAWQAIQPDPPPADYNWGWQGDARLATLAGTGVQLLATIDDVPYWARGEPYPDLRCTSIRDDRLDEFAQFVTDLVNRYKEPPWNIHTWELRNEPDGTTRDRDEAGQGCAGDYGDKYAQMLSVAYPAIKAADPEATVLMGGVAYDAFIEWGGPFNRYFPDDVMENGGAAYMDAINFHYFSDFFKEWERWTPGYPPTCGVVDDALGQPYEAYGLDLIAKTEHFRNRLAACFGVDKPVWITELAEHGYPDSEMSLAQQARYVIQGHTRGLAAGAENITWFALVSPDYDPNHQGLLFEDLSPKPAYYAYQTLTGELEGYEYLSTLSVQDVEGYVFRDSSGHEKTLAWAWSDPWKAVYLTFQAGRLRVVERDGTVTYVDDGGPGDEDGSANGSVVLRLPPVPADLDADPPRYTAEPLIISK